MNTQNASSPPPRALNDLLKDIDQLGLKWTALSNCSRK